jgi:putative ABC transport system permease protein
MKSAIVQDAQFAWRLIQRQPAYTALVALTMALGIAATTVLSSVAYGVLVKPLPWADAPRLVRLYETRQGSTRRFRPMMTNATYLTWQQSMTTLDAIGAWRVDRVTLTGADEPERIPITEVTPSLFPLLRASPLLGYGFVEGDAEPGHPAIVMLSYGLWQNRFGGRADIVGQTLRLDGASRTVVGVMPASFAFPDRDARAWIPFYVRPVTNRTKEGGFSLSLFQALGRLAPGATPEQAAAEGTTRGRAAPNPGVVAMAVFGSNGPVDVSATPLLQALTGDVRPAILILLAAVVLLLVTATANVASLQLARGTARRRELAIRSALGASGGRLVRQSLVENVLLSVMGGLAGLALAAAMHRALPALLPSDFPRMDDITLNFRLQIFAIAVSIAAGVGFGLLPALQASQTDLLPALTEDSLAPVGIGLRSRAARARTLIMAGQVTIAFILLVGAALMIRSFVGLLHTDTGYDRFNVLTARLSLPNEAYTPQRRVQMLDRIGDRVRALPDVTRVAFGTVVPFSTGTALSSFPVKRRDGSHVQVQTGVRGVSPGYFAALGQRIVEGREFTAEDAASSVPVTMVNREFARKYLDGRALGWTLPGRQGEPDRLIVGVVENAARQSVIDTPLPEVYSSLVQTRDTDVSIVIRTSSDPRPLVATFRSIVRQEDPNVAIESVQTLEDLISESLARPHLYAVLLGTFAAFALAVAGVGLFGVLSHSVAQRAREIGIRSALGAQTRDIVGLVVGQSIRIAGAGIVAGTIASLWLSQTMQNLLYGVTPHDTWSFVAVGVILLAVSALASYLPARRAARVDPVLVLRG